MVITTSTNQFSPKVTGFSLNYLFFWGGGGGGGGGGGIDEFMCCERACYVHVYMCVCEWGD